MQEDNNPIQPQPVPVPSPVQKNIFANIFSKIPKPVFLVVAVAVVIPLVLIVLKGPESTTTKPKSEFSLVESSPSDQQNRAPVIAQPTFVFSKKIGISEKELSKYFTIEPKIEGSWHLEKNEQVVYFSSDKKQTGTFPHTFEYQTTYTVTIDKNFRSDGGKQLAEEEHVSFKTQQNPEFALTSYKSLMPVPTGESIDIEVQNYNDYAGKYAAQIKQQTIEPYNVSIKKATKEELLSYFVYKKNSYLAINSIPKSLARRSSDTAVGQYQTKGSGGYQKVIHVASPVFKTPGIYFVTFGNKYGSDRLFVLASNHVAQVIHDNQKSYVVATDNKYNQSASGVKVEYYKASDKIELLDANVTNGEGISIQKKMKEDTDFVVTSKGDDVAITQTRGYYRMGMADSDSENTEVFSYTDRPIYRPGDTIHYKAVIRVKDESGIDTIKKRTYYVKYSNEYDVQKGDYKKVMTDENGTVTFDTVLPNSETNAYPNITLANKNAKGEYVSLDNLQLGVEFYKKPEMNITVETNEKEYISRDTSHMTVIGKTNYGQPLTNVKFTYRVMLVDYYEQKDRSDERIVTEIYSSYYGGGQELASGASEFDKNGKAKIEFSTQLPDKFIQSQVALLEITPNIGSIPSFGKIAKLIHRGEFALFFDEIEGNTTTGLSGYVEAMDHKNPRMPVGNMKGNLTLTRKENYSDAGQVIETRSIELDGKGRAGFTFRNLKEGSYELKSEFTDPRGNKVTGVQTTYVGAPVQLGTTMGMTVGFDKQKYKAGETARATVTSNFLMDDVYVVTSENRGGRTSILSVERRRGEGRTRSFTISVPVKKETGGAVGINLYAVVKGEIAYGQGTFTVERKPPKLTTLITFDRQKYEPGDTVKVKLTTKDENGKGVAADNSLSVIDAALLQLAKLRSGIAEAFSTVSEYIAITHYDSLTGIYADGPGGGGGCFLEGTQILMGDGTGKNIEDVRVGDTILTKKLDGDNETVKNTVEKTFAHTVTEYLLINNRLKVTPIHRIYLNGRWAEALEAKLGDTLLDANGSAAIITSIMRMKGIFRVYNLTTTPSHTFFADGIYVHNEKGVDPRQNFVDTLYWNPHIPTDGNGEATVSFKLADNVTTFTAQAFSNTKDSLFGEATASIVSYRDLTLIPSFSAFYYQGDKPIITVMAQNSTGNDMDLSIHNSIKGLPGENAQDIHVKGNDLEAISVPLELGELKESATFSIEAKDKNGRVVDSVIIKKPILPRGNIYASWQSFEKKYDHVFSSQFPTLDVNRVIVSIVPNAVAKLFYQYNYINSSLSIDTGKDLYAYSYILARTRDGFIDPTVFHYAKDKNDFRSSIQGLMEARFQDYWNQPFNGYSSKDTFENSNLWISKGIEEAVSYHLIDEITNASDMVKRTYQYFNSLGEGAGKYYPAPQPKPQYPYITPEPTSYPTPAQYLTPTPYPTIQPTLTSSPSGTASGIVFPGPLPGFPAPVPYQTPARRVSYSDDDMITRGFVMGQNFKGEIYGDSFYDTTEGAALQILSGDVSAIPKLKKLGVPTASDRYIWDGYREEAAILPALALIEKGSIEDADGAIRGLSFAQENSQSLLLYAALRYAERKNIYVTKASMKLRVNGTQEFEVKKDTGEEAYAFPRFEHTYSVKNSKDGKIDVSFDSDSPFPVYGTVTEFSYLDSPQSLSLKDGNFSRYQGDYERSYFDATSREVIKNIELGKTGVVDLGGDMGRIVVGNSAAKAYSFIAEDTLSPNYLYLDQSESYYNPQYKSVLKDMFGFEKDQVVPYSLPSTYSDQAVFFEGDGNLGSRSNILPYVVYNAAAGTYYRPKSSIVYPVLGIVINEKEKKE